MNQISKQLFLVVLLSILNIEMVWADDSDDKPEQDDPWLDAMHENISSSVNSTALWFDDYFALDNYEHSEKAYGEARIRIAWEPRSRDLSEFETRIKLRMKLPNLKNRVDVVFSDYDDERPDNEIRASGNSRINDENRFSLALRWKRNPDSGLSHRIGIGRRLQPFVKSRYRNSHPLTDKLIVRYGAAAYLYSSDGFGADTYWQLAYNASDKSMYRFNNHFYFRDETNDWLWQHSVQQLTQFDEKNALIAGFYIEGLSRPNYRLEEYLLSFRWRKNAHRKWLFYEVEPFVLWRRDEDFSASYGIVLRVEGHFGKD